LEVLLEVKVAEDAEKHGLDPSEVERVLESASRFAGVRACGLMTMASRAGGVSQARRDFAILRQLFERLVPRFPQLTELSMGMSGDFEEAVMEGATMVRIGSLLWEDEPR
jgi:uncharacterized pyridoxal phosphate-containing UPF0001 family protein